MKKVVLLASIAFALGACGKYEEGPGFTVLSKKMRVTGVWDQYESIDGQSGAASVDNDPSTMELTKSGTAILKSNDPNFDATVNGTWTFADDKAQLVLTYDFGGFGSSSESYTILKLENKDMWIKDTDGDIYKFEKVG